MTVHWDKEQIVGMGLFLTALLRNSGPVACEDEEGGGDDGEGCGPGEEGGDLKKGEREANAVDPEEEDGGAADEGEQAAGVGEGEIAHGERPEGESEGEGGDEVDEVVLAAAEGGESGGAGKGESDPANDFAVSQSPPDQERPGHVERGHGVARPCAIELDAGEIGG